jgi:transposase
MSVGSGGNFAPGERRRRSWTRDEKRRIVDESLQEGASIAEVARRHELNANLYSRGVARWALSRLIGSPFALIAVLTPAREGERRQ